eukprot:scaffold3181_cov167-Amphora_coffeaeformis.AAC.13
MYTNGLIGLGGHLAPQQAPGQFFATAAKQGGRNIGHGPVSKKEWCLTHSVHGQDPNRCRRHCSHHEEIVIDIVGKLDRRLADHVSTKVQRRRRRGRGVIRFGGVVVRMIVVARRCVIRRVLVSAIPGVVSHGVISRGIWLVRSDVIWNKEISSCYGTTGGDGGWGFWLLVLM